jgi:hypothetical protein
VGLERGTLSVIVPPSVVTHPFYYAGSILSELMLFSIDLLLTSALRPWDGLIL